MNKKQNTRICRISAHSGNTTFLQSSGVGMEYCYMLHLVKQWSKLAISQYIMLSAEENSTVIYTEKNTSLFPPI